MHALEFLRNPRGYESRSLYSVVGDDPYLRGEVIGTIARTVLGEAHDDWAVTRLSGESASLADVLDEARLLPFLARRRVVLVDEADKFVSAHRSELESYGEHPSETGVLVLMVKSWPSNTRLAKLFDRVGWTIECKSPKESELAPWLVGMAKVHAGKALDEHSARLLVELVGPDAGVLVSELEKLITYVGERPRIERADVTRMVGNGRIETVWRILDAATTGKASEALEDVDRLIASGENAVGLLAAMTASLRKVHRSGMLRLRKKDAKDACREAGIPPFAVTQTLAQHTHLGPARVAGLPALLLRADLDLKGSTQLPPRTILERLLVELARPRQD